MDLVLRIVAFAQILACGEVGIGVVGDAGNRIVLGIQFNKWDTVPPIAKMSLNSFSNLSLSGKYN